MHAIPRKDAIEKILNHIGYNELTKKTMVNTSYNAEMASQEEVERPYNSIPWQITDLGMQVKICGDSKLVVDWINGTCATRVNQCQPHIALARHTLANMWSKHNVIPVPLSGEWITH